jgi:hypothetical protein
MFELPPICRKLIDLQEFGLFRCHVEGQTQGTYSPENDGKRF